MADMSTGAPSQSDSSALTICCPTDASLNRVPLSRLGDGPKCGRCHSLLFQAKAVDLTRENFDKHALQSDLPLVIDLWAEWCGPCRMMSPNFEAAAAILEPRVRKAKLNTEHEPAIANRYGVQGIPTMIMILRGREVGRISGAMPTGSIVQWVEKQLRSL